MIKWNDELIEQKIFEVMEELKIKHFPSKKELDDFYGNTCLTNAISKGLGFRGWSKKLGFPPKDSAVKLGNAWEYRIMDYLTSKGYDVEKMSYKHPYDLLINDYIKIDVKTSKLFYGDASDYHSFDLGTTKHNCDIFICITLDEEEQAERVLIIPSSDLMGQKQLSIGKNSKYNKYNHKYEVIDKYDRFYKRLKDFTVDFK